MEKHIYRMDEDTAMTRLVLDQVRDANVTELGSEDNFPRYGNCYFCVMIERFTNG